MTADERLSDDELLEAAKYPPTWPHGRPLTVAEQHTVDTDLILRRQVPVLLVELAEARRVMRRYYQASQEHNRLKSKATVTELARAEADVWAALSGGDE